MPTHSNWRDAVSELRERTQLATIRQHELAATAGIRLPKHLPHVVAAARLKAALAKELDLAPSTSSTEEQMELLASLDPKRARDQRVGRNQKEASAWIEFLLLIRRQRAIERLQLAVGDVVEVKGVEGRRLAEVVSIAGDGRVYFRGGQGAGAWPDKLIVRCRKGTSTKKAAVLKREAANQAARRSKVITWSQAKELELADFKVASSLSLGDVEQLQETIEDANDEQSIQRLLEKRPHILASLLTGSSRFLIPRPQLGNELVPDFLLSDVDSLGIRWLLIELETPISTVTLQKDNMLERRARKGVSQIQDWREWILSNLDKARRSRSEGGLGLFDIRPTSEGIVLVGRRKRLMPNSRIARDRLREENHIRVHTYDWLVDRLKGILTFSGPPGLNPHMIQRLRDEESSESTRLL